MPPKADNVFIVAAWFGHIWRLPFPCVQPKRPRIVSNRPGPPRGVSTPPDHFGRFAPFGGRFLTDSTKANGPTLDTLGVHFWRHFWRHIRRHFCTLGRPFL